MVNKAQMNRPEFQQEQQTLSAATYLCLQFSKKLKHYPVMTSVRKICNGRETIILKDGCPITP